MRNLSVEFRSGDSVVEAVKGVSFNVAKGEIVALVGEFGSGKTVSALSILKLLPYPAAHHPTGEIHFGGQDLLKASDHVMRDIRGEKISIIFQEPMTSLNPAAHDPEAGGRDHEAASRPRRCDRARCACSSCCARSASPIPRSDSTPTPTSSPAGSGSA